MKESYSKSEAIEILKLALTQKDKSIEDLPETIQIKELEVLATDLGIDEVALERAAHDYVATTEQNRNDMYPEAIAESWIRGKLQEKQIEEILSAVRIKFGSHSEWGGNYSQIHKMGNTIEFKIKNSIIFLIEEEKGYRLRVVKQHFFHGNTLEAAILSIPLAFLLGLLPVTAAFEWLNLSITIFIAILTYTACFKWVSTFTNKKRKKTEENLIQITEFIKSRIRQTKESGMVSIDEKSSVENRTAGTTGMKAQVKEH